MQFQRRDTKPRKRCYYEYPKNYKNSSFYAIGESRTRKKKEKRNRIIFYISLVFLFAAVFLAVFVCVKLSNRPIDNSSQGLAAEYEGRLKALEMPDEALGGGIAYDLFRTQLKQAKANAVVVELKTCEGKLNYNSSVGTAVDIGACDETYENALGTIEQLKSDGFKIIAEIYCFEDPLAASMLKGASVMQADMTTVWLDDSAQNDGNPWLNPYSEIAQEYLLEIISECAAMNIDVIMLKSVCFPTGNRVDTAYFSGEAESLESRNSMLHTFVSKAAEICGQTQIAFYMDADSALNTNEQLFAGSMFDSEALFNAVDFTVVSENSENTDIQTILETSIPILKEKAENNYMTTGIIPIIDSEIYVSTLENMGINNYILVEKSSA